MSLACRFLFEEHLAIEMELFNMTLITCIELQRILSLLKMGASVLEVECADRSFRIALEPSTFESVAVQIEACRIACMPISHMEDLGKRKASDLQTKIDLSVRSGRTASMESYLSDEFAEMSSVLVEMPTEYLDLNEPDSIDLRQRSMSLRTSLQKRAIKTRSLSIRDPKTLQSVFIPNELTKHEDSTEPASASALPDAGWRQAQRLRQLGQHLTFDEWQSFVSGVERRSWKQGETVVSAGDGTRALYFILRGSIRCEVNEGSSSSDDSNVHNSLRGGMGGGDGGEDLPEQSVTRKSGGKERQSRASKHHHRSDKKTLVVGRFYAGDMFGFRTLLLGQPSEAAYVVSSQHVRIIVLKEEVLNRFATLHPALVPKLFCYFAAVQMKRIAKLDEEEARAQRTAASSHACVHVVRMLIAVLNLSDRGRLRAERRRLRLLR